MDFRHLQQFVMLAETLNFRRAAQKLHMAQPPLSVSIRKLETELGVQLFVRGKDGVRLTDSGVAALVEARRALFHAERFQWVARAVASGEGGVLRVGFVGSATHEILPRIVPRFRLQYPSVELVLLEVTSIRLLQMLNDERLDVGIVRVPAPSAGRIGLMTLQSETFVLALPAAHPLAKRKSVKLADLADEPFIVYSAADGPGLRTAVLHACQCCGFTPRISQEAVQVSTLHSLVESGLGVALVPAVSQRFSSAGVVYKSLSDLPASAGIGLSLAWNPQAQTPALEHFKVLAHQLFVEPES